MRQWTGSASVQVMACRLFGTKPLPDPMLTSCQLDPYEQTSVKFGSNSKLFIHAFENIVCDLAVILSNGRWVNKNLAAALWTLRYNDVIMSAMASQITNHTIVFSTVGSGADKRKHQRAASLGFVFSIDRWIPRTNGQWRGKCFHFKTSSSISR